jgi:two-component system, LytTR family, response regulator
MKVLIVDDEPLAREGVRMFVGKESCVDTILEARNGREAVALIRRESPDLVLLDVQMPQMDGLAVVEAVGPGKMPAVIFVTAHDQYAIRAFEINAVDYLLKPVTEERFRLAFDRVKVRTRMTLGDDSARQMLCLLESISNPRRHLTRLTIRSGERILFLSVDEVDWLEASQNYVRIYTGSAAHSLHVPMNTLESLLDPEAFLRIHRSYIVNMKRIKQLWAASHGQYIVELNSGVRLTSGRSYSERIRVLTSNPF